jgi:hypothetical protein
VVTLIFALWPNFNGFPCYASALLVCSDNDQSGTCAGSSASASASASNPQGGLRSSSTDSTTNNNNYNNNNNGGGAPAPEQEEEDDEGHDHVSELNEEITRSGVVSGKLYRKSVAHLKSSLTSLKTQTPEQKCGYLTKKSPAMLVGWQKRYFMINAQGDIEYYKSVSILFLITCEVHL